MPYKFLSGSFSCHNPQLFMSICSYKNHSYIIVGARDSKTGEQYVLAHFGRFVQGLMPERMPTRTEGIPIDIQAFSFTFTQYEQLFYFLKKCNPNISCAVPMVWLENKSCSEPGQDVEFIWSEGNPAKSNQSTIDMPKLVGGLSLSNNCRTNAKSITEKTIKADHLPGVSSFYFRGLPFKAHLSNGHIYEQLFIYPPPPPQLKGNRDNDQQWHILNKLYLRLDEIAKTSYRKDPAISHRKFDALKELYQIEYDRLIGAEPVSTMNLLSDIDHWVNRDVNKSLIDERRSTSFFKFKTSTRNMFDAILKDYKKIMLSQEEKEGTGLDMQV
ncbi:hypothetical protein [Legionella waltersii]|nr:hypothetical protein [Legionella waltersii]